MCGRYIVQKSVSEEVVKGVNVYICIVVEPPELLHLGYAMDPPKVESLQVSPVQSDVKLDEKSDSKSSMRKMEAKREQEVQQEVKQPDVSKQETSKERKDVERPPIFVTLQYVCFTYAYMHSFLERQTGWGAVCAG